MKPEIYVSTDVESDGPIPGEYSMLSFASAAFLYNGELVSTFTANIYKLHGAKECPETMNWWSRPTNKKAYDATRTSLLYPIEAMHKYVLWLKALHGTPVFVGYPAGYDFLFIYWYLMKFAGESPFSFSALDMKTYAMCMMKSGYREVSKRTMPKRWFGPDKHTHIALDDAIEQGRIFIRMLQENTENK